MQITFKLYATLGDYLPADARRTNSLTVDLAAGATVAQVIDQFALPLRLCHLVLIDGVFVPPEMRADRVLADGETLAIWPPVAGG